MIGNRVLCLVLALSGASGFSAPKTATVTASRTGRAAAKTVPRMGGPSGEYDYIIVGGGTAGCVLANRLTEDGTKRVLVLEAGSASYMNKLIRIPAGVLRTFKNPKFDWIYDSEKSAECHDRSIYLCRGKLLGGSSCTNVLLYNRGDKSDYDGWAADYNLKSWSGDQCLPYFKKAEDDYRGNSPEFHGQGGPIAVSDVRYQNPLSKTFLSACAEAGASRFNSDFNDWSIGQEGYGRFSVMERKGERSSSAKEYLEPAMGRKNLQIIQNAQVGKITFDGKTASGVDIQWGNKAVSASLAAGGEVLLSGGAINSPQTLMLSGVGPAEHLQQHGIEVVKDLKGVGENLQDHPAAVVSFECTPEHKGISPTSIIRIGGTGLTNPLPIAKWLTQKSGVLTSTGCDHGGFFKTSAAGDSPDLQMRFLAAKAVSPDGMGSFTNFRKTAGHADGFSFQSIAARAHSRGSVKLASTNPADKAKVETGYLRDERDLETIREGLKLGRKIAASPAFDQYRGQEVYPGAHVQSDADLDAYIRGSIHTSNALVGTCRMGVSSDSDAVVDEELKVHGVSGLRVVDASVMPRIPGGQTGSSTFMVAEKAADMILGNENVVLSVPKAVSVSSNNDGGDSKAPANTPDLALP